MNRIKPYQFLLLIISVWILLGLGCRRDPVVENDIGSDSLGSITRSNIVYLDTMNFKDPEYESGQVKFRIEGNPPIVAVGSLFCYPGQPGFYGKVVEIAYANSHVTIQFDKISLDKVFLAFNHFDSVMPGTLSSTTRLPGTSWKDDSLRFTLYVAFEKFISSKNLRVTLLNGFINSKAAINQRINLSSTQDQILQRLMINLESEFNFDAAIRITTSGALEDRDSVLIESQLFGPAFIDKLPVYYRVDKYFGYAVKTERDTTITINLLFKDQFNSILTFNYWDDWSFEKVPGATTCSVRSLSGPRLSDYSAVVFYNQIVTTVFCGEPALRFNARMDYSVNSILQIPEWQRSQQVHSIAGMHPAGIALGTGIPGTMPEQGTLVYQLNESGVLENQPPTASFVINPPAGLTNTNFELNASGCSDLESSAETLQVRWDFDGDNHYDTEYITEKTIFHVFPQASVYRVVMEVKDEGGLTARATKSLTVDQYHSAPTAFFTVTPESGRTNNYFIFDASGSWDGEDNVNQLKVRWDFDGDDIWDSQFSSSKAAVWIYALPGTYMAKLEVKDTDGMTGSTTKLVKVDPGNLKPMAIFTVTPESGTIETLFQFDASGSSDPEDPPENLRFRWDWNNDDIYDTGYRQENTITHRFEVAVEYTVVLEVSDSEGYASTYSVVIPVSNPNTPPKADFTIIPDTGTTDTLFAFDASICTDFEDSIDQLEVRWDWDNDDVYDTDFMTDKVYRKKFNQAGTFIIKVQVRDSGGLMSTKARLLTVR